MSDLRKRWNESCKAAGLVSIGRDTAAKLLAIVYVLGGDREAFTHNEKLKVDLEYVQDVYGFRGGMFPDGEVVEMLRLHVNELERSVKVPEWAVKMMSDRYGVNLL